MGGERQARQVPHPVSDEVVILVQPIRGESQEVRIPRAEWSLFEREVERGQPHGMFTDVFQRLTAFGPVAWFRHMNQPRRGRKVA